MSQLRMRQLTFSTVVLGLLASASLAVAQTKVEEIVVHPVMKSGAVDAARKQTVSYGDLNLTQKAGQRALLQRISSAGKKVCAMDSAQMGDKAAEKSCYKGAMSDALKDLGNSDVSAMYAHGD